MAGKITITPEEFAEKYARRLKAAIPDIQKGVERVTESPTAKAAAKQDKMKMRINEAIDSGKWAAGLRRVSTESWKQSYLTKGIARLSQGVDGSKDKMTAFANQLLPFQQTLQNQLSTMPDLTLQDSINRSAAWITGMANFKRK